MTAEIIDLVTANLAAYTLLLQHHQSNHPEPIAVLLEGARNALEAVRREKEAYE